MDLRNYPPKPKTKPNKANFTPPAAKNLSANPKQKHKKHRAGTSQAALPSSLCRLINSRDQPWLQNHSLHQKST